LTHLEAPISIIPSKLYNNSSVWFTMFHEMGAVVLIFSCSRRKGICAIVWKRLYDEIASVVHVKLPVMTHDIAAVVCAEVPNLAISPLRSDEHIQGIQRLGNVASQSFPLRSREHRRLIGWEVSTHSPSCNSHTHPQLQ